MSFETIRYIPEAEGGPITILGTTFNDQAEAAGCWITPIYNLNLPLISCAVSTGTMGPWTSCEVLSAIREPVDAALAFTNLGVTRVPCRRVVLGY
ncbi:MAG: hypothetical protein R3A10_01410 [Caldilineaceae bacterium]